MVVNKEILEEAIQAGIVLVNTSNTSNSAVTVAVPLVHPDIPVIIPDIPEISDTIPDISDIIPDIHDIISDSADIPLNLSLKTT